MSKLLLLLTLSFGAYADFDKIPSDIEVTIDGQRFAYGARPEGFVAFAIILLHFDENASEWKSIMVPFDISNGRGDMADEQFHMESIRRFAASANPILDSHFSLTADPLLIKMRESIRRHLVITDGRFEVIP